MIQKIAKILFSTRLMALLFVGYAFALGAGTFIETYYDIQTARLWVYNAWWFELMMLLFVVNFIGNIKRYQLHKKENWAVLLLHLAWIFIIVGAGITRYISDEGRLSLREGETAHFYTSEQTYLTVLVDGQYQGGKLRKSKQTQVLFSPYANNHYRWSSDFKGQAFSVTYKGFIKRAQEVFTPSEQGDPILRVVSTQQGKRKEQYVRQGASQSFPELSITLNAPQPNALNIIEQGGQLFFSSPVGGTVMQMATGLRTPVPADSLQPLQLRALYTLGGMQLVFPNELERGQISYQTSDDKQAQDAVLLEVQTQGESRELTVLGRQDMIAPPVSISLQGLDFHISYGSVRRELPFGIRLEDFIAEKYPGTEQSYASFKSKIQVLDTPSFPYEIYMNHILNHRGYRFFQASFHPDERGTVLSVNHDRWGTLITYIGYTLLYIGLVLSMFVGKTRFKYLTAKLRKLQQQRLLAVALLLGLGSVVWGQHSPRLAPKQVDSLLQATRVAAPHAEKFGRLVVQDEDGRMKPVHTFSSELLRKISKSDTFKQMNPNQVMLSMMLNPSVWYNVDFFYVKKANDSLHQLLGVGKGAKYVRALDFFDSELNYKLAPYLPEAYAAASPNQFQKEFKEADMKLSLLSRALSGSIFRIFPLEGDANHRWVSALQVRENPALEEDTLYGAFIKNSIPFYLSTLRQAIATGDYTQADQMLEAFEKNQREKGAQVMPSADKVTAEILYNRYDIFQSLFAYYLYVGVVMFVCVLGSVFSRRKWLRIGAKICTGLLVVLFAMHTAGLGLRWYVSGHAPWSNAYESMIYVGWATMGAGLLFAKRSPLALASTAFVSSMILMVAHWNWLDPAIGTLQPVLNSYWLMIHVAVIVGSYGPFALGAILGLVSLVLISVTTRHNEQKLKAIVSELTVVNELALTIGLIMLTIGNFLGAQWANESWGRYWGWDPKETWALVSIMVYAFVIHMRIVPKLKGRWLFNLMSVVAFFSILMTYFGVNFYLSGLHSYASGEKVVTPAFVYYAVGVVSLLGVISYVRYRKMYASASA